MTNWRLISEKLYNIPCQEDEKNKRNCKDLVLLRVTLWDD